MEGGREGEKCVNSRFSKRQKLKSKTDQTHVHRDMYMHICLYPYYIYI